MAKIRNYALAAKNITKQINAIVSDWSGSVADTALRNVVADATIVAKETIRKNHEHTQQFGEKLADEVSYKFSHDKHGEPTGVIYVPVSKDPYLAKQMYYLENGAGLVSQQADSKVRDGWFFYILDENEDEAKKLTNIDILKVKDKDGNKTSEYVRGGKDSQLIGYVKESKPVHYMQAARRYLIKNTNAEMRKQISTYFVRKTWKTKG